MRTYKLDFTFFPRQEPNRDIVLIVVRDGKVLTTGILAAFALFAGSIFDVTANHIPKGKVLPKIFRKVLIMV